MADAIKNNNTLLSILFLGFTSLIYCAEINKKDLEGPQQQSQSSSRGWYNSRQWLSGNEWNVSITNDGSFGTYGDGAGGKWPRGTGNPILYSTGLWIGVNNENGDAPQVSGRIYQSDFRPGPYDDSNPGDSDDDVFKVSRLLENLDSEFNGTNSWSQWPVDQGAPWDDVNGDGVFNVSSGDKPYMPLDQSIFTIYSDNNNDNNHNAFYGNPIGAEVRQLTYGGASGEDVSVSRSYYVQYEIINRSADTWYSPRFGFWSDPDIGVNTADDLVGTDADNNLVYTYNGSDVEEGFDVPPAVGIAFLGASPGNIVGPYNLNPYSAGVLCSSCIDGYNVNDPGDVTSAYNRLNGLSNDGNEIINPVTGEIIKWQFGGDPFSGAGWVDNSVGDKRMYLSIESDSIPSGDTIKFTIAVSVAAGTDRLQSITELKDQLSDAGGYWENNFSNINYTDRPILESDCCNGGYPSIQFSGAEIGSPQSAGYSLYNMGNTDMSISITTDSDNISVVPSSATITPGNSHYFNFVCSADDISGFASRTVPTEFATIQEAVNASAQTSFDHAYQIAHNDPYIDYDEQDVPLSYYGGDTVLVQEGSYYEQIEIDRGIHLIGGNPAQTVLSGSNNHRVIKVDNNNSTFTLAGFTIQDGYNSSTQWNGGEGASGGVAVVNGELHIRNNIFINNRAYSGGAIYTYTGTHGLIGRNLFIGNNNLDGGSAHGRAVRIYSDHETGIEFYNNTIWTDGNGYKSLRVKGNNHRIVNNIVLSSGDNNGVIATDDCPHVSYNLIDGSIEGCIFYNNSETNIYASPRFHDPSNSDFTFRSNSPAIDSGDPDLDQDGVTWESDSDDQDSDGTRLDIGYGHDRDPNIAEFRLQDLGTTATVTAVVNSNNQAGAQGSYTGLSMQDDYAGIAIYIPSAINNFAEVSLKPGDEVSITGTLIEYHSLLEIQPAALSDIEVLSEHNSLPAYQIISVGDYISNPEDYESELIHFPSVQIVSGEWPVEEGSGGAIGISDGQNETVMYIDKDFDIDGNVAPFNPFSVSGLASQYDNQQIKPQGYIDFSSTIDAGFEVMYLNNDVGWQNLPTHWEWFPGQGVQPSLMIERTGSNVYNSDSIFYSYDGNYSLKMWGQYTGGENMEGNVFQTYQGDNAFEPLTDIVIEAWMMSHEDDWIGQGSNTAALFAKYFTNGWEWLSGDYSTHFGASYEANIWHAMSLTSTVPEAAEIVQIGVTFFQADNNQHGAVYIDKLTAFKDGIVLTASSENIVHGDTGLVDIAITGALPPIGALDLSFSGFHKLDLIEIVADSTSLMGSLGWDIQHSSTDSVLITTSLGTNNITAGGKLFSLKLAVNDTLSSQMIPIDIVHFLGNTDLVEYGASSGGVQVVWGPTVGFTSSTTTGDYPLTVSFTDTSVNGTFPIDSWTWSFGNDSTSNDQNPEYTYLYPGMYDIELRVEDEFGLADSITYPDLIEIDIVYGDVSFNSSVQAYDATIILRHVVGLETLDSLQLEVGDVSLDLTISALDASYVLQYVVGLIDDLPFLPIQTQISTGDLTMEDMGAVPGMTIDIPIHISNDQNIQGLMGTLNYDPAMLSLDTLIFSDYLDGYLVEYNEINPGEVIVAASGNNPNAQSGLLANVNFEVLEGFTDETTVSITNVRLNEQEPVEVSTEMTISYVLGIDDAAIPDVYALHQNYPNPFNPITRINYDLPEDALVNITIYDMMGRQVKTLINSEQSAGYRTIRWNGTNYLGQTVSAGLYMYVIQAGAYRKTRKMVLLK